MAQAATITAVNSPGYVNYRTEDILRHLISTCTYFREFSRFLLDLHFEGGTNSRVEGGTNSRAYYLVCIYFRAKVGKIAKFYARKILVSLGKFKCGSYGQTLRSQAH